MAFASALNNTLNFTTVLITSTFFEDTLPQEFKVYPYSMGGSNTRFIIDYDVSINVLSKTSFAFTKQRRPKILDFRA